MPFGEPLGFTPRLLNLSKSESRVNLFALPNRRKEREAKVYSNFASVYDKSKNVLMFVWRSYYSTRASRSTAFSRGQSSTCSTK